MRMKKIKKKILRGVRIFLIILPFFAWLCAVVFYCEAPDPRTVLILLLALFGIGIIAVGVVVYEIIREDPKKEDKQDGGK
jgi:O-antigen/teichoic acid export membrane protein